MTRVTLPYPPTLNHLYPTSGGRRVKSREATRYLWEVRAALLQQLLVSGEPLFTSGPVSIRLDFYRPRKSGDLDNRIKAVLDCLTGALYTDDAQVVEIVARRFEDKANPRVEVEIKELSTNIAPTD